MCIIYPEKTYKDALLLAGITKLETRREDLCLKTLTKITRGCPLTQHVTQTRSNERNYFIRSLNNLSTYKCRTDRFKNSFFPNTINIANSKQ
jgi:hypothetical protein